MALNDRIKAARLYVGVSQKELAKRIGTTPQNIYQYESGRRNPKLETLKRIANALSLDLEILKEDPEDIRPYFSDRNDKDFTDLQASDAWLPGADLYNLDPIDNEQSLMETEEIRVSSVIDWIHTLTEMSESELDEYAFKFFKGLNRGAKIKVVSYLADLLKSGEYNTMFEKKYMLRKGKLVLEPQKKKLPAPAGPDPAQGAPDPEAPEDKKKLPDPKEPDSE